MMLIQMMTMMKIKIKKKKKIKVENNFYSIIIIELFLFKNKILINNIKEFIYNLKSFN